MSRVISLKKINKFYGENADVLHALKDINLDIDSGEYLTIVGRSGGGKSTLLNILGFLDTYDSGEYLFNGVSVNNLDDKSKAKLRNEHIGFIFQQFQLIKMLNVKQNIELPLLYQNKLDKRQREKKVNDILYRFELLDKINKYPNELSGGQQQRIAIARALINNPKLILADEPTGALDTETGRLIINDLVQLNKEGKTIVMITHDLDLTKFASKVIKIKDGEMERDKNI